MDRKAFLSHLLILLLLISGGQCEVKLFIENQCSYTVWFAANPADGDANAEKAPGTLEIFIMPDTWSGSIWARTKCSNNESFYFSCETGDCNLGSVDCQGPPNPPTYPATFLNLGIDKSVVTYEVSLNHGFNVPMRIRPDGGSLTGGSGSGPCPVVDCIADIGNVCPPELVATNKDGAYVGCNSACDALKDPKYCCTEGQACQPNQYSQAFKKVCGLAHTYPADNNPPLYKCTGAISYNITLCPL
ncbi:Thaumatin [Melia azedarach]|uniref:Thaumatin n=1 Tax=Melia azedarach TaxID=155640 RepID=A0ACC1X103_MELAZ|nr:Thaumatin [Melia azedarach]